MARDPADGGFRGDRAVIVVAGSLFGVGLVLLALGAHTGLGGPLAAYSDPTASWPVWVQVGLGAVAYLTWWWVNRHRSRAFTVVLLALGIACVLVLGIASYAVCPPSGQSPFWGVVGRVLGLVLNDYNTDDFGPGCELDAAPLALQVAHLAQLAVLLVAATSAVVVLLRGQMDRLVVRFSPRVYLALAVDASAAPLLPALSEGTRGWTRAIVTKDPQAAWLGAARVAGWRIVAGDPEETAVLRTLLRRRGGRHALRGLAVLSPDSVEAQRLIQAVDVATSALEPQAPARTLLRIDDAWQAEDWRRRYLGRPGRWVVDTISENEVTARLLVLDATSREADTLVVVGRSGLAFALLAEVAQQAREAKVSGHAAPPTVVLVGPEAQKVWDEHLLAQRGFGLGDRIAADVRVEPLESLLPGLTAAGRVAVVFAGDVDPEDQRLASRLGIVHGDLLVYSRSADVSGLGATPLLAEVRAFGSTLDAGRGRPVDRWERIAQLVHEAYVRAHPAPGNPARLPWDGGLSDFFKASNVRQVITTLDSAVRVGRSWSTTAQGDAAATPPTAEQLQRMAELEHESWTAHQVEHGRSHADAVPWSQLTAEGQGKARDGVVESLELLATLGYRSFEDPDAQWRPFERRGEVTAVRRAHAWDWFTSSGAAMRGYAGDWEVTDANGSRAVSAASFPETHELVAGDLYRRVGRVEARRAVPGERVVSPEGIATATTAQWVLRRGAEEWLVGDAHLRATYAPAETSAQ